MGAPLPGAAMTANLSAHCCLCSPSVAKRRTLPGRILIVRAQSVDAPSSGSSGRLQSLVSAPLKLASRVAAAPVNFAAAAGAVATVCVLLLIREFVRSRNQVGGSVSDLIRRGQLRSDRNVRPDSRPLKYEDPFNNPLVKIGSKNPIVRMCGKIFRLTPVTLTEEKVVSHQNRRIQAYHWRRPVVFLNEGDPVPEGVDPEEVRWIPSNHPFATTQDYIDEELAQKNVYQTRGVPSRVRAEHEALRKKMKESVQKAREDTIQDKTLSPPSDRDSSGKQPDSSVRQQSEVK
ncbi:protein MULTIPLE CHLOROPLAST DIVISION SITE 1 [Selaginella moellendorffii]|uniref:protein MULTIPLE CHLOROPLAST DIVISION SITE 1 n=1 Tax=Selaginella moellendorffii TaxID=88036 RepID=UPI000D1C87D3|nr:protein MULTIPLE CHLOROPLAST DIVISION SITE 1 [Selaginella moellendorffii]|eukprot:XP_024521354.1 protein MULTIPLE CHLOROPLAST DIVISION SITE 1 [Selaginella moellendorffii]